MQLKFGEAAAVRLCSYHALVQVASQIMGGSSEQPVETKDAQAATFEGMSYEAAMASVNAMMRMV